MGINSNETNINSSSSTFFCPYAPYVSWENDGSIFNLIIGFIAVVASFPTVLLNAFIILAIKQTGRELQKSSNIMLSSLAVTDLLVGAIVMPTCASIDFFTLSQVSFEYTCMLYGVNIYFFIFICYLLVFTTQVYNVTNAVL